MLFARMCERNFGEMRSRLSPMVLQIFVYLCLFTRTYLNQTNDTESRDYRYEPAPRASRDYNVSYPPLYILCIYPVKLIFCSTSDAINAKNVCLYLHICNFCSTFAADLGKR